MFEEQDYIVVTLGDDSADSEDTSHWSDRDNSSDVVIIEDSDSELSEKGLPMDSVSTDQPSFQGRADNHQQLSQMPPGAEVLPSQGDRGVSQVSFPRSFKSYRSGPGNMEPIPAPNTRGSSPPRENNMKSPQDAYTCSNGPLSKKMKLKRRESNNGDSYPQSCCHVFPVRRQENDFNSSIVETYFRSGGFYEQDPEMVHLVLKKMQEEQEEVEWERKWLLSSNQSSPAPSDVTADAYHSCLCPDDTPEGTCSGPCSPGHGAHSTSSLSPSAESPTAVPAAQPAQATGAPPVRAGLDMLQRSFSDDPESWSVEEVILFLKQKDPQISGLLADSFREHDIDGKALLLLKFDVMIKYMGLKLGTALKLCHYIEKLQEEHHLDN